MPVRPTGLRGRRVRACRKPADCRDRLRGLRTLPTSVKRLDSTFLSTFLRSAHGQGDVMFSFTTE